MKGLSSWSSSPLLRRRSADFVEAYRTAGLKGGLPNFEVTKFCSGGSPI